jgi:peptidoglycan/LPS O-acetylase OafA/YrhL
MHSPAQNHTAQNHPAQNYPPMPPPHRGLLGAGALVAVSTAAAFTSHAMFGAPGDHPLFLLVVGCVLAFAVGSLRKAPPVVAGFASLAGFPIVAIVDLARHGGHSLLPIEFAFYAIYAGLGVLAAVLGRTTARKLGKIVQA